MDQVSCRKILTPKLRASSLIEVIVAMIVISIFFGLAILIYLNVQRSGFSSQRVKAEIRINEMMCDSLILDDKQISYRDMIIFRYVVDEAAASGLKTVTIQAETLTGKLIYERKRLVYAPVE